MPGAQPKGFRCGDSAELFAEFVLNSLAFTTRVPRQEDIGHDLLCALAEHDGTLVRAGPSFTVQVKSKRENLVYEKEHEVAWIKNQDNPFFICISRRESLEIELYSTWNMLNGFLAKRADRITLVPGNPDDNYQEVTTLEDGSEQTIPLGRPILRISAQDAMDEETVQRFGAVLRKWIELDRENIVNRSAGMHWVVGPRDYDTNESLKEVTEWGIAFFWHAKNLCRCRMNLGRAATALRLTIHHLGAEAEAEPKMAQEIKALEQALSVHCDYLQPLAKSVLRKYVGLVL